MPHGGGPAQAPAGVVAHGRGVKDGEAVVTYAALGWAVLFAAQSFYAAAGGTVGLETFLFALAACRHRHQ
jgi:hypothetical protein